VCDVSKDTARSTTIAVETVRENMGKYTRREVERAKKAKRYMKRMAHIRPAQLIKLLKDGRVKNSEISEYDVARIIDIEGKGLGELKGKTTRSQPATYDGQETRPGALVKEDQILHIDIMFINGIGYLLGVFTPLDYIVVRKIKSRTTSELFDKVKLSIDHIKRSKLRVTIIRCDEESGIDSDAMQSRLSDYDTAIELDVAAGSESVGVIERKIRTIKERIRGYISVLPFATDEVLEEWLVKNVVYYLNWTPTSNSVDGRSPLEKLTARNIDAKTDLRHGFGDYVQIGDGETDNTMEERTRGAIALMPAANRDGSWYYLVLKSWRTVKRNKATALPMPDEVIDYIEGKARVSRQKRKVGDSLKMGLWRTDNITTYSDIEVDITMDEEEQFVIQQEENAIGELQPIYVEPAAEDYITMEEQYDGNGVEEIDYNDEEAKKIDL
jgi:hypothetical protein